MSPGAVEKALAEHAPRFAEALAHHRATLLVGMQTIDCNACRIAHALAMAAAAGEFVSIALTEPVTQELATALKAAFEVELATERTQGFRQTKGEG